jgi:hypothetical protein
VQGMTDGLDAHAPQEQSSCESHKTNFTAIAGDPQGHVWTFGQIVRYVTRQDAEWT